ncbi:tetratricopeptide repeat protein [Jiella sp. MQZ9-1]|uniref:Ancillary SecYEG translocon subunit n=1 Tax=Jiella flava TaxID=2816857 RepID=A0A939JS54_9HYPH|nr:tetratricopeptide repeat protein [Jiella flava]MBO0662613.1 tetratricopeptide repeat protein [Jiella flava]MCD2471035.1 tetratricopeptide repeat protein [Jiella flava]
MSDESFFREVDEELRQDKVKAVWTRFGSWLVGAAVVVVAGTAGYVAYERYQTSQANAAGDRYAQAMKLAEEGKREDAIKALKTIADNGIGAYPALAQLTIGGLEAKAGDPKRAVAAFDAVANNAEAPQDLRDMAALRAGYVLVDHGTLDEVHDRVDRLTGDSQPLRFAAREAIALAAWKAGDGKTAKPLLEKLVTDGETPSDMAGRARILLALINSGATGPNAIPPAKPEPAGATPPASADNGLGVIDLPGLLDTKPGAAKGGGAALPIGTPQMPTSNIGMETTGGAPGAAPAASAGTPAPASPAPIAPSTTAPAPTTSEPSAPAAAPKSGNAPALTRGTDSTSSSSSSDNQSGAAASSGTASPATATPPTDKPAADGQVPPPAATTGAGN